jgi:isoquinoline 1-oxidoreductase beta subunit
MKRRTFLIAGGVVGGGLLVGVGGFNYYVNKRLKEFSGIGMGEGESLNAYVRIRPDNRVTLAIPRVEMGQGIYTALSQLIAEELEVDFSSVDVVFPQAESPYTNFFMAEMKPANFSEGLTLMQKVFSLVPNIITGGSTSVKDAYGYYQQMGAMAREMLISAAAKQWQVTSTDCFAESGYVVNKRSGEKKSFGELASLAVQEKAPENPPLKKKADFKLIGKPVARLDVPAKVTGKATFGLDVRVPNMKYAVIRHPSYVGGKITAINNIDKVQSMPGVIKVVQIEEGVAVIANDTWHAKMATSALELQEEANKELGHLDVIPTLKAALSGEPGKVWEDEGDIEKVLAGAGKVVEAEYMVPYLAHACMEPLNCTVLVDGDKAEAWTGNQSTTFVINGVADGAGISKDKIKTNITYLGGGFGRRGETDFVLKAAKIAKQMPGTPVQLVYTREEDMKNDFYRPAVVTQMKAALDDKNILGWKKKVGTQGALSQLFGRNVPLMTLKAEDDQSTTEGMRELPYKMNAAYTDVTCVDLPASVGTWRSVGHSHNAFFSESFMDECAATLKRDPYELRKELLADSPRYLAVLNKVAEMSKWSEKTEGKFKGIAIHESFGSIVGEVAEISLTEKNIKVEKVFCVIDCGKTVNPRIIESQMQSGIVYGLTAALYGEISLKDGKIVQSNFPNYEMVMMNTMPHVEVAIIDSDEAPGGVGEPGTPPIAPALTNAIFAASGERIRSLPLSKQGYQFV